MRILIATTQIPFLRGGAEILAEELKERLTKKRYDVDIVSMPFKWYPPERILDHMLACRLLDLTESSGNSIDQLIALKFPAYLINHPNKVIWMIHQHRQAYELWGNPLGDLDKYPNGISIREAIQQADVKFISEAKKVFTISSNVSKRLKRYCNIDGKPLYHPPKNAEKYYCSEPDNYLLFPSRISQDKRQYLILNALAQTKQPVCVRFAGSPINGTYMEELEKLVDKLKINQRVIWLGEIDEEEKREQYAHSLGVIFPPFDEDYGYVTLEAMLSSKPIITCEDSGGPLEFVLNGETGLVTKPTISSLAKAMDILWEDRIQSKKWGEAGKRHYEKMNIHWDKVIEMLIS